MAAGAHGYTHRRGARWRHLYARDGTIYYARLCDGELVSKDLGTASWEEAAARRDAHEAESGLVEIRAAQADARAEYCTEPVQKSRGRGQPKRPDSPRETAKRTSIPAQTIRDTERHVGDTGPGAGAGRRP